MGSWLLVPLSPFAPQPYRRESIKREEMLLIFTPAPYGLGITLVVFGLECAQIEQRILFLLLLPDACQFSRDLLPLTVGNGVEHLALFMHQTPLARGCRKQSLDRCHESIMPISDDQIDLGHSPLAQILEETTPAIFVFFGTRTSSKDFFVPFQIDAQCR
jgi:hypothetical protein